MQWYLKVLKQYADFNGRARRSEFWFFMLFNFIIEMVLSIIAGVIIGASSAGSGQPNPTIAILAEIPLIIYCLAVIVPTLAVSVRRLHDTSRNGWLVLLSFVPIANIVLLIFYFGDSTPGANEYGPNPKEMVAVA
jgi:uncharacterized membrane protein YhaH (DUF805 family)